MVTGPDIILANRSFVDHEDLPGAGAVAAPAPGGLVAAVRGVFDPWDGASGTTWIGAGRGEQDQAWVDNRGAELLATTRGPLRHRRLFFDDDTWQAHYARVSNSFLWPLLHLTSRPLPLLARYYPAPRVPVPSEWAAYRRVNEAFTAAATAESDARTCWIHDYQLALVPAMMRAAGFEGRIGFFLHTPFPDLAIAERFLDSRGRELLATIVAAMLGSDLVGLQTEGDCERLAAAATALCGATPIVGGVRINGRKTRIAAHPVGIDVDEVLDAARTFEVPMQTRRALRQGLPLVVGLERCDFTKGIPERLRAVAGAFTERGPFAYVGIASPTRPGVDAYSNLQFAITAAAREACAAAETVGGTFVHLSESVPWGEVVALQREADVVFTSSLADGMNIVPLQAVAAQSMRPARQRAVIITGKDAGVASAFPGYEGDGLVPVDPLDPVQMTAVLGEALAGRPARISDRLIEDVRRRDALAWATRFLADLEESQC